MSVEPVSVPPLSVVEPGRRRLRFALLAAAGAGALAFWWIAALPYLGLDRARFGPAPEIYWPRRHELLVHIAAGTIALLVGPVQLWLGATGRRPAVHRVLGRLYLAAVAAGALSAVYLSLTSTAPFGWSFRSGLLGLALAWSVTTSMAIVAIRRRAFDQHRQWAIRSYVATFAFVFFRLAVEGLEAVDLGAPAERYALASWLCWAVPLVVTEPLLQWRQITGETRRGARGMESPSGAVLADDLST